MVGVAAAVEADIGYCFDMIGAKEVAAAAADMEMECPEACLMRVPQSW
jgi:hypothetical protein